MTREEEIRNAIDTTFPMPHSDKVRSYELSLIAIGFEAGVKCADANPKSPWISVKDDLPCNHSEMICRMENTDGTETIDVFCSNSYGHVWTDYMVYENGKWRWNDFEPDFWMVPPKLPK